MRAPVAAESGSIRQYAVISRHIRRGGRAVECTGLENQQGLAPFVGSNPTLSAKRKETRKGLFLFEEGVADENHGSTHAAAQRPVRTRSEPSVRRWRASARLTGSSLTERRINPTLSAKREKTREGLFLVHFYSNKYTLSAKRKETRKGLFLFEEGVADENPGSTRAAAQRPVRTRSEPSARRWRASARLTGSSLTERRINPTLSAKREKTREGLFLVHFYTNKYRTTVSPPANSAYGSCVMT